MKKVKSTTLWEISWVVHTYDGPQRYHTIYFIDKQTGTDTNVIQVCPDHCYGRDEQGILKGTPYWNIRALLHGRLLCEMARYVYEMAEMMKDGVFDYADDISPYPRPDWPGLGILHDEKGLRRRQLVIHP